MCLLSDFLHVFDHLLTQAINVIECQQLCDIFLMLLGGAQRIRHTLLHYDSKNGRGLIRVS